jgi:plasmid stability protein
MQYTIRNVPNSLDAALRRRARERGKSINEVAIEALARGVGATEERIRHRDLRFMIGTWQNDPEVDDAIAAQDTVDEDMWR